MPAYVLYFHQQCRQWINPRRAVGGGCLDTPPSYFCSRIPTSFTHILSKFHTHVTQGQVTKSRQVTSSQKKSLDVRHSIATPNDWSPWTFQRLISVRVSIKCRYLNVDIAYPMSGQFCDLYYKSMAINWKAPPLVENHSKHSETSGYRWI